MGRIEENLQGVRAKIAEEAQKSNRLPEEVELIAISKTHPAESIREAFQAGQNIFGESRVQEARAKIPDLPSALRWHFVGHLQKTGIRHALPLFELFYRAPFIALGAD